MNGVPEYTEEEWFDLSDEDRAEYDVALFRACVADFGPHNASREFALRRRPDPVKLEYVPVEDEI